jgi:hypothetical protein
MDLNVPYHYFQLFNPFTISTPIASQLLQHFNSSTLQHLMVLLIFILLQIYFTNLTRKNSNGNSFKIRAWKS